MNMEQIVKWGVIGFGIFLTCVTSCTINKHYVMLNMVTKGASPLEAHCAVYLGDVGASQQICAILSTKDK